MINIKSYKIPRTSCYTLSTTERLHNVNRRTRWYPREIQQLVCTYELPETRRGEEGGGPDQLNPKCQDLSKSAFSEGGGWWWFRPTLLKYLSGGTQGILATGMCSASQIVSHILRMWRLIIPSLWMHLFHSNNVNSFFSLCLSEFYRKFENKGKLNRLKIFLNS